MKKKVLVTGGTGFLGSSLVRHLLRDGYAVRTLDNNARGNLANLQSVKNDVEVFEGDIRDAAAVEKAAKGVEAIHHLAYINGTEFFYTKPELVLDVAVRGMVNVLDACRKHGIGDFVLASSSEVYQTPPQIPTAEDAPLSVPDVMNPRYSYGGGKIICELMAINYGRTGFERMTIFRPHNVYGPAMGYEHVIPQFVVRAMKQLKEYPTGNQLPFPIQGSGQQARSFIFIDDFTDGLMRVVNRGAHLNIYHIGTEREATIKQVAELVVRQFGREPNIQAGEDVAGSTQRRCPDTRKLQSLGFLPKVSLEEGIAVTTDWYRSNTKI